MTCSSGRTVCYDPDADPSLHLPHRRCRRLIHWHVRAVREAYLPSFTHFTCPSTNALLNYAAPSEVHSIVIRGNALPVNHLPEVYGITNMTTSEGRSGYDAPRGLALFTLLIPK